MEKELFEKIKNRFSDSKIELLNNTGIAKIYIESKDIKKILGFVSTYFEEKPFLETIIARDIDDSFSVSYIFREKTGDILTFETETNKKKPELDSIASTWPGAEVLEREIQELFGIVFDGKEYTSNMFLADQWVGKPMKKDYVFPEDFKGIEHRRNPLKKEHERP